MNALHELDCCSDDVIDSSAILGGLPRFEENAGVCDWR